MKLNFSILFIGLGSIAKRHIKNLQSINKNINFTIDILRHENTENNSYSELNINKVYYRFCDLTVFYDIVFITNPTKFHLSTLKRALCYGKNFFIEKPVIAYDQIDLLNEIVLKKDAIYYVACPLRYSGVIQYVKKNIDVSDVVSIRSISSSYLPEWRPSTDYRKTYSAQKRLGGGVSMDLIHEWDYLTYLYGMPLAVKMMMGKKTSLEIDSDDYAIYIAEYADKIIELHLDYFGRIPLRECMLITKDDTIVADIQHSCIKYLKRNHVIYVDEDRDTYQCRELEHFLDIVLGKCENDSTIKNAVKVLKLTQGVLM